MHVKGLKGCVSEENCRSNLLVSFVQHGDYFSKSMMFSLLPTQNDATKSGANPVPVLVPARTPGFEVKIETEKSLKSKTSSKTITPSKSSKSKNEFKDDHAFEEFEDESEFNDDQVEARWNSSKTTTPSKSSKMKASSMTIMPSKSSKSKTSYIGSENLSDWSSSTTSQRSQADWVWKFVGTVLYLLQVRGLRPIGSRNSLGLIFICYKSEVAGQSGLEIQIRPTPKRDC